MNRHGVASVTGACLILMVAGCGGGLQEGGVDNPVQQVHQTDEFKSYMETAQKKMVRKGQMKRAPAKAEAAKKAE